jgi:hypothetical protein
MVGGLRLSLPHHFKRRNPHSTSLVTITLNNQQPPTKPRSQQPTTRNTLVETTNLALFFGSKYPPPTTDGLGLATSLNPSIPTPGILQHFGSNYQPPTTQHLVPNNQPPTTLRLGLATFLNPSIATPGIIQHFSSNYQPPPAQHFVPNDQPPTRRRTQSELATKVVDMARGTTTQPTRVSKRIAKIKQKAAEAAVAAAAEATNQVAAQKRKREAEPAPPAKRARTSVNSSLKEKPAPKSVPKAKAIPNPKVPPIPVPILTQPAAEKLKVFNFGTGEYCELGLGPKSNAKIVKRPRLNAFLDIEKIGVVAIAYGGMHGAAITHDGKVYTWGVNDLGALGRVTKANEEKMKDADDSSDSDDEDDVTLNEDESTPKLVDLPKGTVITRISCCDSATFAVTETGLVYGWGTFRVRHFRRSLLCYHTNLFLVEGWCARFLA